MTAERRIRTAFLLLTIAPVLLGFVGWRYVNRVIDAAQDVARTNERVKRLEKLISDIKDVEVAQREYVLTGDEFYLRDVDRSRANVEEGIARLDEIGAEKRWTELLRTLVPQKLDEIRRTIALRQSGDIEGASRLVLDRSGPQAVDDIARVVRNMVLEENRMLTERSTAQEQNFVSTLILFGLVLLLNVLLIWSVFYLILRETRQAQALNEELERRVALRTEELQRSNDDLQQFAYIASHDLKEPMRTISSYSTLLQRRYQGRLDEDADTYIGFLVDGVRRMNLLITDLLDYSRAGEIKEEEAVEVNPETVLAGVLTSLKITIADSRATVTHDPLPAVVYDPMRLSQLLQNLIGNAIKYRGRRRPVIHVSAAADENETVFSVRDNGEGIAPEHQESIFGIFKRLHGKDVEGTGIGLAMCKKIVERHGGRIWVESTPGVGSTFYFSVPHVQTVASSAVTV